MSLKLPRATNQVLGIVQRRKKRKTALMMVHDEEQLQQQEEHDDFVLVTLSEEEKNEQPPPAVNDIEPSETASDSEAQSSVKRSGSIGGYLGSVGKRIRKMSRSISLPSYEQQVETEENTRIGKIQKRDKPPSVYRSLFDIERDAALAHIKSLNYPAEKYHVMTEDGYVINMYRIPHGKEYDAETSDVKKPVVFLQHGVCNSSSTWVVTGEVQGLAFILANAGYDVWLGNNRGTQFARQHIRLTESHSDFWAFSWDQMAKYDLPAQIDFILNHTGQNSLCYIGHSQGTAQCFAALSSNQDLQSKIDLFIALAPVTTLQYQTSKIFRLLTTIKTEALIAMLGIGEIGKNQIYRSVLPQFASKLVGSIGLNDLWGLCMDCDIDPACLPILTQFEPSPTSTQTLAHWSQLVRSGKFHAYDHGPTMNETIYGQPSPPEYDLKNIHIPVAVFYGELDYLANPLDVEKFLLLQLPNVVTAMKIPNFKHNDFVWGRRACEEVYPHIIDLLNQVRERKRDQSDLENQCDTPTPSPQID